jgi:hypothetical protein
MRYSSYASAKRGSIEAIGSTVVVLGPRMAFRPRARGAGRRRRGVGVSIGAYGSYAADGITLLPSLLAVRSAGVGRG